MENKYNFKKLLCYNIVNNSRCVYKTKCMFAHTLNEQKKDTIRQYIYDMIYLLDDLSNINLNENKVLFEELLILTKECKNCINKKCPGGYNCKFGTCLKENKICYNDLLYGKCFNITTEVVNNDIKIHSCIHGIHLTEKKLIPHYQRMLFDNDNANYNILLNNFINYNIKNNIISFQLNDKTIKIAKELIQNKLQKNEILKNYKLKNNFIILNNTEIIIENESNLDNNITNSSNKNNKILLENDKIN